MKIGKICLICNKEFKVYSYRKNIAQFCSRKCKGIYQSKNNIGKNSPHWKEKIKKVCPICNKIFKIYPYKKNIVQFCSRKCTNISRIKEKIKKVCPICNKNFEVFPSYNTKFCSQKCMTIYFTGKNNSNWKGGISKSPYCKKWTEKLREEIRVRDNKICQNCDKTEIENKRKLSVHHIHYDKENCYPDLITLCCSCNSKVNYNCNYWEELFMKKLNERNLLNYFGEIK